MNSDTLVRPSSNDVLLALFPTVENNLIKVVLKFNFQFDKYLDKKTGKLNVPSSHLAELEQVFPRSIYGYKVAVDRFVDFGKYSVSSAIDLLFQILPNYPNNNLYKSITSKIQNFQMLENLWNDFLYLFFADCVAQLLSKDDKVASYGTLVQLGYAKLAPTNDPIREHLRNLYIKQYSVIFSFISISHLDIFMSGFTNNLNAGDMNSCFIIHRFLRLSTSQNVTINHIESFLGEWLKLSKTFKKSSAAENAWAYSLCYLTAQFKTEGLAQLSSIMHSLYDFVITKIKDGETDQSHFSLAAILLMRDEALYNSRYQEFVEKYIIGKVKKCPAQTLRAFLMILRGSFISRSSLFWEWGSYHNNYRPGVEFSNLNDPSQPQKDPNSYTEFFFKHFTSIPGIENYSDTLADILMNLAARDFSFFAKDTLPRYIITLGPKCLSSLCEALLKISAPEYHFEEWISDLPLNQGKKIGPEIKTIFVQIKSQLYQFVDSLEPLNLTTKAFWFDIKESFAPPVFELPMQTLPISSQMSSRITESTDYAMKILKEWGFNDNAAELSLRFETSTIERVSQNELIHLRLLTFFPHIISFGDLQSQSFAQRMKNYILSNSVALSLFAISMLSHLYSANAGFRLEILTMILRWLSDTSDPQHLFIILELFVKLFDLSLKPESPPTMSVNQTKKSSKNCSIELIQNFADLAQATIIYLLAQPFPELRDLTVASIERLSKFTNSLKVSIPLEHILTDYDSLISTAVAYKAQSYESKIFPESSSIPKQYIPFRIAASSRFNHFFSYYLPEILASFGHQLSPYIIQSLVSISILNMNKLGNNPGKLNPVYYEIFKNLSIVITNSVPIIDLTMYKLLLAQFPTEYVSFYNYQAISNLSDEQTRNKLLPISTKVNDQLSKVLSYISNNSDDANSNKLITQCFSMMRWQAASMFGPSYFEWIQTSNVCDNPNTLISALQILKCYAQNPDFKFTLSSQPIYYNILTSLLEHSQTFIDKERIIQSKQLPQKQNIVQLIDAYLDAVFFFATSITIDLEERTEGAFRIPHSFSWINDFASPATKIIKFLEQFTTLRMNTNKTLQSFSEKSVRCISALICACQILQMFKDSEITLYESLVLETEKKGWPSMHFALHRNYKHLIKIYVRHAFDEKPEIARYYFRAIIQALIPDPEHLIDMTKRNNKKEDKRTQMILTTMMFTMNAKAMNKNGSNMNEDDILDPFERVYNRDILQSSGQLLFLAFIYLMDDQFEMRSNAFSLIMRLVPFIISVCEAHDPIKAAESVKKLGKYSALFHSSVLAVPQTTIKKICSIMMQFIPQLSEQIIKEAIQALHVSNSQSIGYSINQSAILDFIIICLQNIEITRQTIVSEISSKFAVYTPYSLLEELLGVFSSIRHSGRATYLTMWGKISQTIEAVEIISDFLFNSSKNPENSAAVQSILLHISQNYSDVVINALGSRLTYSYWFYDNVQLHINDPKPFHMEFHMFSTILSILIELLQLIPEQLKNFLHIIIHFSLIFYDYSPQQCCTLMFILLNGMKNCPQTIIDIFLPPGKLTWKTPSNNYSSPEKKEVTVSNFTSDLIVYLKSLNAKKIINLMGKEAAKWAVGCGNLKLASRSAIIFSCILQPIDGLTIVSLVRNCHLIAIAPPIPDTAEYLMSAFTLLSALIDRNVKKPEFSESFAFIFKTALQFINYTSEPKLKHAALTIIAKYVMNGQTTYEQMKDLLAMFTELMSNLDDRRTVDGAFMSCFHMKNQPTGITGTHIEYLAFIAYLPRIYSALASCYNIEPFLTEVSEAEAIRILRCGLLISNLSFIPEELSLYFSTALREPATTTLDEFSLKCAALLTQNSIEAIVDAAPLWNCLARGKNIALREAVIAMVYSFLTIQDFVSAADAFSIIVSIAADTSSEASADLLERFMKLSGEQPIPVKMTQYNFPSLSLYNLKDALNEIDVEEVVMPSGSTNLQDDLLLLLPLDKTLWKDEVYQDLRNQLSKIQITPFTVRIEKLNQLRDNITRDDSQTLNISQDAQEYLNYKDYL